jgi:tryptophan synthase alpha chain
VKQRIDNRFAELKREGRAAFIPYVMAGDPDAATALAIVKGLPAAGADLIELGFPFSDPMAEGPPIQRAAQRALAKGMTIEAVFDLVSAFREGDQTTPIILMGYMNIVVSVGLEAFARRAAEAGVDGLIIVDCPPEEAEPLADALDGADVSLIRLATPTTDDKRLPTVVRRTSGFVYYVSVAGVTGAGAATLEHVEQAVARLRRHTDLPVAIGFGIRTPEHAASVARLADGVVVGSALVDKIANAGSSADAVQGVLGLCRELAEGVRKAR